MTHHDYLVNKMRSNVANDIDIKGISWEKAYNALTAMGFFESWDDEEFYYRPVDMDEVSECVYDYWAEREPKPERTLEDIYPFLFH